MRSSNVYLGRLCLTARWRIVEDPKADPDDVVLWEELMPPFVVMEKWNFQYATATKLANFLERFLEYYPVAHQASRTHGIRGGCRPPPYFDDLGHFDETGLDDVVDKRLRCNQWQP